jgi:hemerythrin-like domain-containing protein/predicted transcriptional regulator
MRVRARLERDHETIGGVLDGLRALRQWGAAGPCPTGILGAAVEFFGCFVTQRHDAHEERVLFPLLRACGVAIDAEPLASVQRDHGTAGQRLSKLEAAARKPGPMWDMLGAYIDLLEGHLEAEKAHLLPCVESLNTRDEQRFEDGCAILDGEDSGHDHERLVRLAHAIHAACAALREAPATQKTRVAKDVARLAVPVLGLPASLAHVVDQLHMWNAREALVLEHGLLVGLVSSRDVEPFRGNEAWTAVSLAMAEPVTVEPDTPATVVAGMLLARAFNCVPVATQGVLIGLVCRADLLRFLV